jgi:itaconyl-CoA hydratase
MPPREGGRFFEDFKVGETIRHGLGRTLTDVDNIWFTLLTCNANQIHFNADYARSVFSEAPFKGRLVVNAYLVLSIVVGLSVNETSRNGIMLGQKNMRMLSPVFAGDTLYSETTILGKGSSKKHPNMGIVELRTEGLNQDGAKVVELERTIMVRKKGKTWS